MLSKKRRLLRKEDFSAVFRRGRYIRGGFISVKILKNDLPYARIGFVVGVRIAKKSTARNLIKRRLRAATRELLEKIHSGIDVVVLPEEKITTKDFKEIVDEMRIVFEQARIIA